MATALDCDPRMATPNEPAGITFRATSATAAGGFDVLLAGQVIGAVARFTMGAGQFGSSWMATTPGGLRSSRFPNREAAAAWLSQQLSR
jgi:hypothetical protein